MSRFERFIRNAGGATCFKFAVVALLFFLMFKRDFRTGDGVISILAFLVGVTLPYFTQEVVIRHFSVAKFLMNAFAFTCIILLPILRRVLDGEPEPAWLRISGAFLIAMYLSGYFWLYSDERFTRT